MKTTNLFLLILFSLCAFKCSEDDSPVSENNGLIGKWKLTEYLADPGDGSGKWQKVDENASSVIEFKANGDFLEVKGPIYSSVNSYNSYKILDDKRLQLSMKDSVANPNKSIWYYSDLTPAKLTLSYGCIEPCGGKYIAVE